MYLNFGPRGTLQIDDARLIWKNFAGRGDRYNREGDRNFHIVIDDEEIKDALINDTNRYGDGWNVKIKPPHEEGDIPFMVLKVKVKFNDRGPRISLLSGDNRIILDEDTVSCLDDMDIERVDLDIRPYDDELPSGAHFRTAYLERMEVVQRLDRFEERYQASRRSEERLPF